MHFRFDFDKTLQAAGVLLDADDNHMEFMRLVKLLYIADRELLATTGRTLTGDRVVALKTGRFSVAFTTPFRGKRLSPTAGPNSFTGMGTKSSSSRNRDARNCRNAKSANSWK